MKKTTTLLAIILISSIATFTACKKTTVNVKSLIAYYTISGGAPTSHSFLKGSSISVSQTPAPGLAFLSGIDSITQNSLALNIGSATSGDYVLGNGQASYITLHLSQYNVFTTNSALASGKIHVTYNNASKWATGTFTGTVVNTSSLDTIQISGGSFSMQYQ